MREQWQEKKEQRCKLRGKGDERRDEASAIWEKNKGEQGWRLWGEEMKRAEEFVGKTKEGRDGSCGKRRGKKWWGKSNDKTRVKSRDGNSKEKRAIGKIKKGELGW